MKSNISRRPGRSQAMVFIILFGVVSLFSDMTHESVSSIRGIFLSLVGASAATIGFISGLGELIGYGMRYVFGRMTDRTKHYWPMVILGYALELVAVPSLALIGEHGWIAACVLLVVQRMGKAIKKPAKDTVMSFASFQIGHGKSFAIQEMLDQIGAFLGPVLLYVIMLFKTEGTTFERYSFCFGMLVIPALITMTMLLITKSKFPHPEKFEPTPKEYIPFKMQRRFIFYIIGISLFAFGFIDYSLIVMHLSKEHLFSVEAIPLVYAGAMIVDAVAALVFGWLFDHQGTLALVISTLLSVSFPLLVFGFSATTPVIWGIAMWGVGMGAQESILKAAVASMVPKQSRATGYGIFECSFGLFWFLGSWLLGVLYDYHLSVMIGVSMVAQLAAIPMYILSNRSARQPVSPQN
ncbi:MAG: MFS transporter [Prevotella sp.]|nr:MFS transporter [Prevotella sp.]